MKKKNILFTLCILLASTVLFANGQNERTPQFADIINLGVDESQSCKIETKIDEDGLKVIEFLPERSDCVCITENRPLHILHLFFDTAPFDVTIYNDTHIYRNSDLTWGSGNTDGYKAISEGTYDIMVHFKSSDNVFSTIISESVIVEDDLDLTIESTDAIYTVDISPLDEDGNTIPLEDELIINQSVFTYKTPMQALPIGFIGAFTNPGNLPNLIKHSPVSENYSFGVVQTKVTSGKIFEISYDEYSGVNSSFELTNDPLDYRHSPANFSFNPGAESQYLCLGLTTFYGSTSLEYYHLTNSYSLESDPVIDLYLSNVINTSQEYNFAFLLATIADGCSDCTLFTPSFYLTENDRKIVCATHYPPKSYEAVLNDGECFNFNMAIPRFYKSFRNNINGTPPCIVGLEGQGNFKVYGSENQYFVLDTANSNYHVTHNGNTIDSGILGDFEGLYNLLGETYSFIVDYDSYYIKDIQGMAEFNLTFDLGADDPDSPFLTSLRIKNEDGESVTSLPQNGNGTIELTALDKYVVNYEVESLEVYYKNHNENDWLSLPVSEETSLSDPRAGQYFIGDMSSITTQYTNGTYVDLKIRITDETGNSNQQIWQPALYVSEQISVDDPAEPTHSTIISSIGPNPFNDNTTIQFSLAKPSSVRIDVYNVRGEKVRTLVNEELGADSHIITWDGKDTYGKKANSGIYFCKIKTDEATETKKMMFIH